MSNNKGMPRAKRERIGRIYGRMLTRISHDLDCSNAGRLHLTAELISAKHHIARVVSIIESSL